MAPKSKRQPQCQVCLDQDYKYTCPQCKIAYCSLGCYKKHKGRSEPLKVIHFLTVPQNRHASDKQRLQLAHLTTIRLPKTRMKTVQKLTDLTQEPSLSGRVPLRPLTSLKWPYVPDESAFPDPLKRDDPKTLQLPQYEAIATSPAIRKILSEHKNLPELLTSIDKLRGPDREHTLQKALGITAPEIDDQLRPPDLGEDVLALRELAEAIEAAVRGGNQSALGLDWEG
ncbi:hypothetical protein CVT25_015644 [Psilocybe cyanescens]|uniref:HIT-type domain-containing protein n=1 Tax=Psilocybe cyanescens TaxID=93625 RepID=A0A409WHY7_PSICY|nr:hypothetical protein CVT25_015644 [Psilocybe cyanescens]